MLTCITPQAKDPDADLRPMAVCFCVFVAAAFLRPVLRTIMYIVVGAIMFVLYFQVRVYGSDISRPCQTNAHAQ